MINKETNTKVNTKCALIAVIGAPNSGKSTLVNKVVGSKVSIVTPKAQTTRNLVRGITTIQSSQLIFIDTPGIFKTAKRRLERSMVKAAWSGVREADVIILVVDGSKKISGDLSAILNKLAERNDKTPNLTLVINKTDISEKQKLLKLTHEIHDILSIQNTFMVSAKTGEGLGDVTSLLKEIAPPGPWLFPEDDISDMPLRLLAAEITREKLYFFLQQELPYECMVETTYWINNHNGDCHVHQIITVTRDSQKPIVLGAGGKKLKNIGTHARQELERLLEHKVHLFIHVKVESQWRDKRSYYSTWGLDFDL